MSWLAAAVPVDIVFRPSFLTVFDSLIKNKNRMMETQLCLAAVVEALFVSLTGWQLLISEWQYTLIVIMAAVVSLAGSCSESGWQL